MQVSAHWLVPQSLHTLPAGPACPVLSLPPPRPLVSDLNPQHWPGGTIRSMARQPSAHTCCASLGVCSTLPGGAPAGPPLPPASLALPRQLFCGASGHPSRGAHSLGNWRTTGAGGSTPTGTHAPSLLPEAHWPDGAGRERVGCHEERGQGSGGKGQLVLGRREGQPAGRAASPQMLKRGVGGGRKGLTPTPVARAYLDPSLMEMYSRQSPGYGASGLQGL